MYLVPTEIPATAYFNMPLQDSFVSPPHSFLISIFTSTGIHFPASHISLLFTSAFHRHKWYRIICTPRVDRTEQDKEGQDRTAIHTNALHSKI